MKPSFGFDAAPTKVELKFPGIPIKIVLQLLNIIGQLIVYIDTYVYMFLFIYSGFVGECKYHRWFVITVALLGSLFGLGISGCFFFYCIKNCQRLRGHRNWDTTGHNENVNKDFHIIPGTVKSLAQMYDDK